jgi:hypothetical protein
LHTSRFDDSDAGVSILAVKGVAMRTFCHKHESKISGVLSCFDRMLFRGYLPLMSGAAMAQFLMSEKVQCDNLKTFLTDNAERVKDHAQAMAASAGRPYSYLASAGMKMERHARGLAERDGVDEGLVCIFSKLEPCKSFSFKYHKTYPFVNSAKRKCLHIYYYFMDREFGLVHVQIQTWFPLRMQVFVNGHDWLARKLDAARIKYTQCDNVFVQVEDVQRAQRHSDRMSSLDWPSVLNRYARRVNPLMGSLITDMQYYWVTAQCEYSTDVLFRSASSLKELYPRLISHSSLCFGAKEVMSFLGKKLVGQFRGELVSDTTDRCKHRLPGVRIKHRVKMNWIKMYDKAGSVLRVETVINDPEAFKVRRQVRRGRKQVTQWVPMRKGVANLFRYREISMAANCRYLDALAVVDDPTPAIRDLDKITERKRTANGKSVRAFNPLAREERQVFEALSCGEHHIRGFTNRDIRQKLTELNALGARTHTREQLSAKVSRLFHRLHLYGLIAKVPRSRRWRLSNKGLRVLSSAIRLREQIFPDLYASAYA